MAQTTGSSDEGRLDRPPPPGAQIILPPGFGRRSVVFCDTEEEFDWSAPRRRDSISTRAIVALPETHRRLRGHGAVPSYLVDHPIASDPASIDVLAGFVADGGAAIGAQLHPWVNPPFEEPLTERNSFPGNLPIAIERSKIEVLTRQIERSFGVAPRVYRAGRYGVGPNTAALLEAAGYAMDVSIRALFDYSAQGGPDFSRFGCRPYWAGPARRLIELPLTAAHLGRWRNAGRPLHALARRLPYVPAMLSRSGLLNRVALTPEGMPLAEALEAVRVLLDSDLAIFSLSFHSPSAEPGHTPYVRDEADLRAFHAWWDGILGLLARSGVAPCGIDEVIAAAWSTRTDAS